MQIKMLLWLRQALSAFFSYEDVPLSLVEEVQALVFDDDYLLSSEEDIGKRFLVFKCFG